MESNPNKAIPVDDEGNPLTEQPPRQHGPSEDLNTTPSGETKVKTGKDPEAPVLLVQPANLLGALGNAQQVQSMKEHEAPTKPAVNRKED